jgi:putative ATPase
MRPRTLDDFLGQEHLLGPNKLLRKTLENDRLFSMIFWGPPGVGKTTLARVIASLTKSYFVHFSAVTSGINEVKRIVEEAKVRLKAYNQKTVLFIDELHRFNKAQQDAFLPHVEDGSIVLIGATTENPSFEVNTPLLSRSKVLVFQPLTETNLKELLQKALTDKERGLGDQSLQVEPKALEFLASAAHGDARVALNSLEIGANLARQNQSQEKSAKITVEVIEEALQHRHLKHDRTGEEHFNLISAVHKSLRGGDPDAAIYYVLRMLEAGEDPAYVARRLIRFAAEDIGNADPQALILAVSAFQACEVIGLPECKVILVQLTAYLACAPKDNRAYKAENLAREDIQRYGALPVPLKLRNAPTKLMKDLGYGENYKYPYHYPPDKLKNETHLPEKLIGKKYYQDNKTSEKPTK